MGQVKKAFMDWCEKHDKNPSDDEMQAMSDLEAWQWRREFEHWLMSNDYDLQGGDDERK
jgi:hypothetical protein